jgi:iron-sulfur cluster assembly accessory protein
MKPIHKDMTIGDVMSTYEVQSQQLATAMERYGLHCVGCHASTFETLQQGVLGHGLGEEVLETMVKELNAIISHAPAPEKKGFSLYLTDEAIERIRVLLSQEENKNQVLRLAVVAGGCAGASYDMKFVAEPEADDHIIKQNDLKIFVEKDSAALLNGLQINYTSTMMESGFKFENPNASGSCGCGTSFSF